MKAVAAGRRGDSSALPPVAARQAPEPPRIGSASVMIGILGNARPSMPRAYARRGRPVHEGVKGHVSVPRAVRRRRV